MVENKHIEQSPMLFVVNMDMMLLYNLLLNNHLKLNNSLKILNIKNIFLLETQLRRLVGV
jgi:hypothetical protein